MKGGRMRLKEHEIASIKLCAERHFGSNCAVRLFGSRADDTRSGGDIDLHVQVDDDAVATMACRIRYLSDLEAALGERKVDLVVEGPARKNGYIDRVARESGVLL
jgi:predicted nucleotidyltransferase